MLRLQRTAGNSAVARLLRDRASAPPVLQAKLMVGAANDPLEREADRIADAVLRSWPTPASAGEEHESDVRRAADPTDDLRSSFQADDSVALRLSARRGSGEALPPAVRGRMEAGFGSDFSAVRIHRDAEAADLSTGLAARAFTHGADIYFGRGAYDPGTRSGQHLLAHELAHVVQQGRTGLRRRSIAVTGYLGNRNPSVQRDFVKDVVHQNPSNHPHDAPMARVVDSIVPQYESEVDDLLKKEMTSEAIGRLQKIWKVVASYRLVLPESRLKPSREKAIDAVIAKAKPAVEGWQAQRAAHERDQARAFEGPALEALVKLDGLVNDAATHAEATVKAGITATTAAEVEEPAMAAGAALADARAQHDHIGGLASGAGESTIVKEKTDAYVRASGRALDLATRMAGIAADVLKAWKEADVRKQQATRLIDQAKVDVQRLETELAQAEELVSYLGPYVMNLMIDVAGWRKDPTADLDALKDIVDDARLDLLVAGMDRDRLDEALDEARGKLAKVTKEQGEVVVEAEEQARQGANARAAAATAGSGEGKDIIEIRTLAGGVEAAEKLLGALAGAKQLVVLLRVLGKSKAETWVLSKDIGPAIAAGTVNIFGEGGLRELHKTIGDTRLLVLLKGLGPPRLAELIGDVGLEQVADLCGSFTPPEIEKYVAGLGGSRLGNLLEHVKAPALKDLDLSPDKLSALLVDLSGETLSSLISALGGPKAKALAEFFPPGDLKDVLVDLPPSALAVLGTVPKILKGLLDEFTAKEIADFGLSGDQFKQALKGTTATVLKALAADLTYPHARALVLAFPKGSDLQALVTDLASPSNARLVDLFTLFSADEIKQYRNAVGRQRFKFLVVDKSLPAAALKKYGAPMLKDYEGSGHKAWGHATSAKISKKTGQVSGAHDEAVFTNFIAQTIGQPPGPRATVSGTPTPAAIYDVTYTTHHSIGAKTGTKTLIQNLDTNKAVWWPRFNEAVWESIRSSRFPTAGGAFVGYANGQRFGGFCKAGRKSVDSIFPVL